VTVRNQFFFLEDEWWFTNFRLLHPDLKAKLIARLRCDGNLQDKDSGRLDWYYSTIQYSTVGSTSLIKSTGVQNSNIMI
jgi:hypothetical protein